jgi:hypothetical protein
VIELRGARGAPLKHRADARPGFTHVVHTSKGRGCIHIIEDGRKGLRARLPDHNGGAIRPVGQGRAHDQRLGSEFCTPAFPCQSKMDAVFMMGGVWMAFFEQQETPIVSPMCPRSSTILNFPAPLFDLFEATVEASLFRAERKRDIGKFLGSTCLVL